MSLHSAGEGLCTVVWTVCAERVAPPAAAPVFPEA